MKLTNLFSSIAASAILASSASAAVITITTAPGATTSGGAVSARADFSFGAGFVDVTLTNLTSNLNSPAQLLAGIYFDVVGTSLSGGLTRTVSAPSGLVTINADQTYSTSTIADSSAYVFKSSTLDRWNATGSGSTVTLTTLSGGDPKLLIIGPDNGAGKYVVNSGVIGDNPSVLTSIFARITVGGATTQSTVGNVTFQFGTASGTDTVTPPNGNTPPVVPDSGTTVTLLGGALLGLSALRRFFR